MALSYACGSYDVGAHGIFRSISITHSVVEVVAVKAKISQETIGFNASFPTIVMLREFTDNLNVSIGIFGIRQKEGGLNAWAKDCSVLDSWRDGLPII